MFEVRDYLLATECTPNLKTLDDWWQSDQEYQSDRRMAGYLQTGDTPYQAEQRGALNAWEQAHQAYRRCAERWHRENPGDAGEAELRRLSLRVIRRYVRHPKCNEPEE